MYIVVQARRSMPKLMESRTRKFATKKDALKTQRKKYVTPKNAAPKKAAPPKMPTNAFSLVKVDPTL